MNKKTFILCLLVAWPAYAGGEQVISLKDGSQIRGELVSFANGVYTIKTQAMGQISLTEGNIVNIASASELGTASPKQPLYQPPSNPYQNRPFNPYENQTPTQQPLAKYSKAQIDAKFQQTQQQVMSNPQAMSDIATIAQDPEIMQIISDPAFMQIVSSRDVNALSNNPKTQALLNNPKMKALIEKLQSQQ